MTMLLPEVEKWRVAALTDFANALASANNDTFQVNIDKPKTFFTDLGSSWQGAAYNAAYDRVDADHTQARKVWTYIDDLITEIHSAASDVDSNRTVVLGKVGDARGAGLNVADNWVVCDKDGVSADTIKAHQDAIDGALRPFYVAVANARTKIGAAAELVRSAGDLFGSDLDVNDAPMQGGRLGAEDGKAVADAVKNGDSAKLDEISARLPTAVLTPEQKQALLEGKDVPSLSAEAQDYYKEFFANAGKDGLLGLNDRLEARATSGPGHPADTVAASQQQGLADGMLAVTNEHLGTGTGPDGKLVSPGSYTNLPSDIRQLISGRIFDKTDGQIAGPDGIVKDIRQREQLADLLSKASPDAVGGKTFSMEVARQGASLARYLNESEKPPFGGHLPPDFGPDDRGKIETAANRLLGVGERNHEADYQLLTGRDSATGARIPNDLSFGAGGDDFHPARGNYDPKEFARDVFGHTWDDHGRTAAGLFDWTADHSHDQDAVGDLSRKMLTSLPGVFAPDHGKVDVQGTSFYNEISSDFAKNPELATGLSKVMGSNIDAFVNQDNPQTRVVSEWPAGHPGPNDQEAQLTRTDANRLLFLAAQSDKGRLVLETARQAYENAMLDQAFMHGGNNPGAWLDQNAPHLGQFDAQINDAQMNAMMYQDRNHVMGVNDHLQEMWKTKQEGFQLAKQAIDAIPIPGGKLASGVAGILRDQSIDSVISGLNPPPKFHMMEFESPGDASTKMQLKFEQQVLDSAFRTHHLTDPDLTSGGHAVDIVENSGGGIQRSKVQFMIDNQLNGYVTQYGNDQSIGHIEDLFSNNDAVNRFLNGGSEVPK
ncbi:TPR repeat region-containing protein [Nocardia sp. CDC160]|uniref:TPR repeat region-containing protein n=1 Tax=Nocardia sp. CDC160 TaxID=3112166 RepID=UPI002DB71270|nr:hypothetical protein [Nocardia sp. CDC160]MEC3920187.1 hypothetical protein [Nocardia sp. CDC160]